MTRKLRVDGRDAVLQTGDGELFSYTRDGVEVSGRASLVEMEPGVYSVLLDGRSYRVRLEGAGEVEVGTRRFAVEVVDPRAAPAVGARAGQDARSTLTAPMPGKVVRVLARAGEAVEAGQGILVVEAMKMQNEIKSPKAGVVASLSVEEGAAVSSGQTLAVIE